MFVIKSNDKKLRKIKRLAYEHTDYGKSAINLENFNSLEELQKFIKEKKYTPTFNLGYEGGSMGDDFSNALEYYADYGNKKDLIRYMATFGSKDDIIGCFESFLYNYSNMEWADEKEDQVEHDLEVGSKTLKDLFPEYSQAITNYENELKNDLEEIRENEQQRLNSRTPAEVAFDSLISGEIKRGDKNFNQAVKEVKKEGDPNKLIKLLTHKIIKSNDKDFNQTVEEVIKANNPNIAYSLIENKIIKPNSKNFDLVVSILFKNIWLTKVALSEGIIPSNSPYYGKAIETIMNDEKEGADETYRLIADGTISPDSKYYDKAMKVISEDRDALRALLRTWVNRKKIDPKYFDFFMEKAIENDVWLYDYGIYSSNEIGIIETDPKYFDKAMKKFLQDDKYRNEYFDILSREKDNKDDPNRLISKYYNKILEKYLKNLTPKEAYFLLLYRITTKKSPYYEEVIKKFMENPQDVDWLIEKGTFTRKEYEEYKKKYGQNDKKDTKKNNKGKGKNRIKSSRNKTMFVIQSSDKKIMSANSVIFEVFQRDPSNPENNGSLTEQGFIDSTKQNTAKFKTYKEAVEAAKRAYVPDIVDSEEEFMNDILHKYVIVIRHEIIDTGGKGYRVRSRIMQPFDKII